MVADAKDVQTRMQAHLELTPQLPTCLSFFESPDLAVESLLATLHVCFTALPAPTRASEVAVQAPPTSSSVLTQLIRTMSMKAARYMMTCGTLSSRLTDLRDVITQFVRASDAAGHIRATVTLEDHTELIVSRGCPTVLVCDVTPCACLAADGVVEVLPHPSDHARGVHVRTGFNRPHRCERHVR